MGGTGGRRTGRTGRSISAAHGRASGTDQDLALEIAPVRVNLIAAGFVDTPLSASLLGDQLDARREQLRATLPIRRVVGPADIAALAVHLMTNTAVTGATYDIDKDALADVSVVLYLAMRFGLAAAIMAVVYCRALRKLTLATVWAGATDRHFCMFCGYAFQIAGLKLTTPSKAAFITGSSVVLVPILLAIFAGRRATCWTWAGSLAALAGLYFLSVPREGFAGLNRGDPIVFCCAVAFALHFIFIGKHVERHSVAALSFLQVATTAILSTVMLAVVLRGGLGRGRGCTGRIIEFLRCWRRRLARP